MENGIQSLLGHAGFYRRFIKDFSKISKPLCPLLEHNKPFNFDESCLKAFEDFKKQLVTSPIVIAPDWMMPFELMCDPNEYVVRAVIGQRRSMTFIDAQLNYTTIEKELLVVVFTLTSLDHI